MFFDRPTPPVPNAGSARSLAVGVLALCSLCEDLLSLAAAHEASPEHLTVLAEQLEAVRGSAMPLAVTEPADRGQDPYSFSSLGQWVWRE